GVIDLGRRTVDGRRHRVVQGTGVLDPIEVDGDHVGRIARGEDADVIASQDPCATDGGQLQSMPGGQLGALTNARGYGKTVEKHGLTYLGEHVRRVIGGRAVDTEANRDSGRQ